MLAQPVRTQSRCTRNEKGAPESERCEFAETCAKLCLLAALTGEIDLKFTRAEHRVWESRFWLDQQCTPMSGRCYRDPEPTFHVGLAGDFLQN